MKKTSTHSIRPVEENSIEILTGCTKETVLANDYISCINAILNDPTVLITYSGYSRKDINHILSSNKTTTIITNTENYQGY